MGKNGRERPTDRVAANDNGGPQARIGVAVLTIAHLLGRQIAREEYERRKAANDNAPASKAGER